MLEMVKWLRGGVSCAGFFEWLLIPLNPCLGFEFRAAHPRPAQRVVCHSQNPGLVQLLLVVSTAAHSQSSLALPLQLPPSWLSLGTLLLQLLLELKLSLFLFSLIYYSQLLKC